MKPYKIIPPVQVYALNITTTLSDCDKCPPEYAEYIVEEDGNYYITLNGINQSDYDLQCMQGDIIQMWITHDKVIADIERLYKEVDNSLFIRDDGLSGAQTIVLLLLQFIFTGGPIIYLLYTITNVWIDGIILITWWSTLEYTSSWIQHNITNKIAKWLEIL